MTRKVFHYRRNILHRKSVQLFMQPVTPMLRISVQLNLSLSFLWFSLSVNLSMFQVSWVQGSSIGSKSPRYCICGIWKRTSVWCCQRCTARIQDHPHPCNENIICQEVKCKCLISYSQNSLGIEADSRYELICEENSRWRNFKPYVRDVHEVKYLNWHFAMSDYLV